MAATLTGERLVDVVIPTYNNREALLECLARLDDPVLAERIVVDDVSSDGTADAVRKAFPDVSVIGIPEHRGVSHAINLGVRSGTAPYVLLLNDDVLPSEGGVSQLVAALRLHPEASCATGRLVDARTGETQDAYRPRSFPTVRTLAARLSGFERVRPGNRWSGQHLRVALPENGIVTTPQQAAGACFLLRRDQFDAIGGWNEDYWFYYEDTDFARRLSRFGPLVWVGHATFRHVGMRSIGLWRRDQRHARLHFGSLVYAQRHFSRLGASLVALMIIAVSVPRLLWVGIRRRPGAANYRWLIGAALSVIRGKPIRLRIPAREVRRLPAERQLAAASR
jgi:GT2 family glycosyltransferase